MSVRIDEYLRGVESGNGLEFAERVCAGLQNAPKLSLLKVLALLATCEYLLLQRDLRVFKDGVDFKRGRAEIIKNLRLHPHRTDNVLLHALLHFRL